MKSPIEKLQGFLSNGLSSIGTIFKILIRSKYIVNLPQCKEETCIIMGNGPSLKAVISQHKDILKTKTLWAVNYFANSDNYEALQPAYYLIIAQEVWREGVRQKNIDLREKLFDNMIKKTTWPVTLFLPAEAFKSKFLKQYFDKNPNITFSPINNTPVEGYQWFTHLFFNWNLGMPRPHNVIIPSLMVALNMGFKKIYLTGVEHSWLPTISVNEQNEVLHRNKHFYDHKEVKDHKMYYLGIRPRRLHEVLHKLMMAFKGYFIILEYAKSKQASIFNTTKGSFIDAFERKDIEEVL